MGMVAMVSDVYFTYKLSWYWFQTIMHERKLGANPEKPKKAKLKEQKEKETKKSAKEWES